MGGLVQRIDGQQALCRRRDRVGRSLVQPIVQKPGTGLHRQFVQPLSFTCEDILEYRIPYPHPIEERAAIKRDSRLQSVRRAVGDQPLEGQGIGLDGERVESDALALDNQRTGLDRLQRPAQRPQSLAQAPTGLTFTAPAPQQRHQLFAGLRLSTFQGEVGEQQYCFGARHRNFPALRVIDPKAVEKAQAERRHRAAPFPKSLRFARGIAISEYLTPI
jgi:hypothetical protein